MLNGRPQNDAELQESYGRRLCGNKGSFVFVSYAKAKLPGVLKPGFAVEPRLIS
jgi:hypothetical protein